MQLFFRSFLIFVLGVAAFVQVQAQSVCPNIVLQRCNQNVIFDWSHTPAGSLQPNSCAVGQGGGNQVGSTCASAGTTVTAPVAAGVYRFKADSTAGAGVSSDTCTVSYAPGINCANQCQDGFDNDGDGQVDAADTLGAGAAANAGCACPNATSESATCANNPVTWRITTPSVNICPATDTTTTYSSTISWEVPAGQSGNIAVSNANQGTSQMGGASGNSSVTVDWVTRGNAPYTFDLRDTAGVVKASSVLNVTANGCGGTQYKCASNSCAVCSQADINAGNCTGGSSCTATGNTCGNLCGNGAINSGEQCDNGNDPTTGNGTPGNLCSATCQNVSTTRYRCNNDSRQCSICTSQQITNGECISGGCTAVGDACGGPVSTEPARCTIERADGVYSGYAVGETPSARIIHRVFMSDDLRYDFRVSGATNNYGGYISNGSYAVATSTVTLNPLQAGINRVEVRDDRINPPRLVCLKEFIAGSAQTPIKIGWDDATYPPTRANVQLPLTNQNIPVYVNIGSYAPINCSVRRNNEARWVNEANTTSYNANNAELTAVGRYVYTLSCTRNSTTETSDATLDVVNSQPINIGFDTSYTKTKSTPAPANEAVHVTTGGRKGCSVSGNFESANTVGINMPFNNPNGQGFEMDSSYAVVNRPARTYPYTLSCPGVATPVTATLTVTPAAQSSVSCTPSSQSLSSGSATINWATTLNNSPVCTVNGSSVAGASGSHIVTSPGAYTFSCTNTKGVTGSATCSVTNPPGIQYKCASNQCAVCSQADINAGNCTGGSSCSAAGQVCGCGTGVCSNSCPQNCTNDASCQSGITVSPQPVISGAPFSINFGFTNTGGATWGTIAYNTLRTVGGTMFGTAGSPLALTQSIAGKPIRGTATFATSLRAPTLSNGTGPLRFALAYKMNNTSTGLFGAQCQVADGGVLVRNPQCNDGIDNEDLKDRLIDCADPACIRNGVCDRSLDTENDPVPGVVLKISANPQLVRQGGSSVVSYEVKGCSLAGVPQAWTLKRDGEATGINGSGASAPDTITVDPVVRKTTYTLTCGNTSRSATISTIKINEF